MQFRKNLQKQKDKSNIESPTSRKRNKTIKKALVTLLVATSVVSLSPQALMNVNAYGKSSAEVELYSGTKITENDITSKLSKFNQNYLKYQKETEEAVNKTEKEFIENHLYMGSNVSELSYEELCQKATVLPDASIINDYSAIYTSDKAKSENKTVDSYKLAIVDSPVYKSELTKDSWKYFVAAYQAYYNVEDIFTDKNFETIYNQYINDIQNIKEFHNTSIKSHVDVYYYNPITKEKTTKEEYDAYITQMNNYNEKMKIVNSYNQKMNTYTAKYLNNTAYRTYLNSLALPDKFFTYETYIKSAKEGALYNIPKAPEKPENFDAIAKEVSSITLPQKIEIHVQFTYTLTEEESATMLQKPVLKDEKIARWVYEKGNELATPETQKTYNDEEHKKFQDNVNINYDKKIKEEKERIKNELEDAISGKLNTIKKAEKIVKVGKSKLGARYCWAATGPNMFDCSGFVYWVMNNAGVSTPRLTADSFTRSGKSVDNLDSMIPGDIISLGRSSGRYYHIGIYMGNGQVIECTGGNENTHGNNPNACVKTTSLSSYINSASRYTIRRLI